MAGFCFGGFVGFDCSLLYISMIIIFFLGAIFRKWVAGEVFDVGFTLIGATIIGELVFIITIIIFHSIKTSFILALVGLIIGGFILSPFLPDTESSSGEGGLMG